MKANSANANFFCLAAVAGLATWLAVEHRARRGLAEEQKALQQQVGRMADILAENEQLSNRVTQAQRKQSLPDDESRELLRLRGEAGVLRQQCQELEGARSENRQAHVALEGGRNGPADARLAATADYWPRDSWAFAGYATADATLQTSLWAANNGDLKALLEGATGELRQRMEKDFEGKSENEAAIRAMDEVMNLKSVHVLNREFQSDDTMVLTAAFEDRNETHNTKLIMKKTGNGWKLSGASQ